jgi:tRNA A-37 threonylcarbamoyl transferase component Bud32
MGSAAGMAEGDPGATRRLPRLPPRYEPIRLLGTGGMATVWCARDTLLGRRVAVKLLSESLSGDPLARQRFLREARAAARLSGHPHVVTIFDVGDRDGCPYIVMEHLAGGTVADAIRLRAHSLAEALSWIEQAARALDHAHAHGVVHRDVKPANMLLGSDRVLRLGDFGIASLGVEQTLPSGAQLYATAAYIAPEQALGRAATAASDRYALAVAAFELLTGERPYQGETFTEQARAHVVEPPPRASARAPQLPGALDVALARGMAKSPVARWSSAAEMAQALREALEPVLPASESAPPLQLVPAAAGPRLRTRPRLRTWPRVAALGALALAALAAAVAAASQRGAAPVRLAVAAHSPAASVQRSHDRAAPRGRSTAAAHPAPSAAALEARGHELMLAGRYAAALPVLREAVRRATPGSLTYAYALFDLGRTLRLDGDPAAAIPILERRLLIPNQPQVVAYELALARQQAGQQALGADAQASVAAPPAAYGPPASGGAAPSPATSSRDAQPASGAPAAPGAARGRGAPPAPGGNAHHPGGRGGGRGRRHRPAGQPPGAAMLS